MKSTFLFILINFGFLSAQTLDQIKKQVKDAGLNAEQLEKISNDKDLYNDKIKFEDAIKQNNDIEESEYIESRDNNIEDDIKNDEIEIESIEYQKSDKLEYFGYRIFESDPTVFQSSSFGAVDPNYNIGPGDQLILMLWGESQFRQEFSVDREGYVFLPDVGQVFVNGLNLEALEKKFFQVLSKVYSTLNPQIGKPTTFMDISIADLRPLRIIVLGEVNQPGAYLVSPTASLSSSLYYFNGPTTFGSLREIRLLRKGKLIGSIDFYDYLLSGTIPNDFRLQMDDVIFIPPRGKSISIKGEINRQGIYELKDNEDLNNIINIAGNLKASAYSNRCQVTRIVPKEKRDDIGMDRMIVDINLQELAIEQNKVELFDGDVIEIFPIKDLYNNYVSINGSSVIRTGKYQLTTDMKVLDLIQSAEGLLNDAYLEKAHLKRYKEDLSVENITLNLNKLFEGDTSQNIDLKFMDELWIYNTNEINNIFTTIEIYGPVKNEGRYDLDNGKTLGDLIILAGGFKEKVDKVKISVARLNNKKFHPDIFLFPSKSKQFLNIDDLSNLNNEVNNFILSPYDLISIYSDPMDLSAKYVNISGAIYFPGNYPIISDKEKVSDVIQRAGGLLPKAFPMASSFKRNNRLIKLSFEDILKNKKSSDNFTLMDGDEIMISTKTNIVQIVGEVKEEGYYKFHPGKRLKDYIRLSGGYTADVEKKEIWVTYPDGTSKQSKSYLLSPKIYDSSVITVGTKKETEPLDKTEFAKEVASIISDFLQIALTFAILTNNSNN